MANESNISQQDHLDTLYDFLEYESLRPVWEMGDPFGFTVETVSLLHPAGFVWARHDRQGWGVLHILYSNLPPPNQGFRPFRLFGPEVEALFWRIVKGAESKSAGAVMGALAAAQRPRDGEVPPPKGQLILHDFTKKEETDEQI